MSEVVQEASGPEVLTDVISVSRETLSALNRYVLMLQEWQTKLNLVGPATLPDAWRRHILDSAQLFPLIEKPEETVWMDMGCGAGFPGLVMAIMGVGEVHLVESIAKKCRFLEAVVDALALHDRVIIHNARLEAMKPFKADIISARALAKLTQLFDWGHPFAASSTRWLLLKGQDVEAELAEAQQKWAFEYDLHASLSDPRGRIVEARGVARKAKK
ncbi:MAG TPA: 16S rRNA (guanine(527)-N(7))-methyltransferase RsmG [Pedomonas sp.]|uniref:16S rRNA (guanine(527)-N(7))-methyltransferase RsmG n=1 Tax=Pedomonas sp. TaxID=2976421 RepID=UPI002F3E8D27